MVHRKKVPGNKGVGKMVPDKKKSPTSVKGRESGQNCCFSLSHISLSWLLILTKKNAVITLNINNVLTCQISRNNNNINQIIKKY